jgi:nucleoside-diphosphate kinase
MEKTLIIFKPDCMEKRHVGNVLDRFEKAGFSIVGLQDGPARFEGPARALRPCGDLPFYPEIEKFMSSRPVIVMALEGHAVVKKVRDLLGPTDSRKAAKGTIRGDFGTEMMRNVVHASDSVENARTELARFFGPGEIFSGQ